MEHTTPARLQDLPFTLEEERMNALTHRIGIILGFIGVPVLIYLAFQKNSTNDIISAFVYGISFITTFTISTIYHSCTQERKKCFYETLDYISIYFMIAGTYTPFILKFMPDASGTFLLMMVWLCTIIGSILKLFFVNRYIILSVCFYVFTGLLFLFQFDSFFAHMPQVIVWLIVAGVVLYIAGLYFFLVRRWYFHHAVWHSFVLVASLCHFIAVLLAIDNSLLS